MKTTTNKIDYTKLPLSAQLERGLELIRQEGHREAARDKNNTKAKGE